MEKLVYADQSAMNLNLVLVRGDVDLSQFTILKSGEIKRSKLQIRVGIIGASHFVTFDLENQRLHEVVACTPVHTDSPKAYYGPLQDASGNVDLDLGEVSYSFYSRLAEWEEGLPELERIEKQANKSSDIGLVQQFPGKDEGQQSKTIIWLMLGRHTYIRVNTVHSYPNEGRIVFTKSIIEPGKEG